MSKTALLVGATGLVGEACLDYLLDSPKYQSVTVFSRRPLQCEHVKLTTHLVDFERLEDFAHFINADDIYCCLGTTMRKAKSKENFRRVDYDYPLALAKLAQKNGAKQFLLVSSMGADASSKFFYLRTKGELEDALQHVGFESLSIAQPSLLLGDRTDSRPGERLMINLSRMFKPFFAGPLSAYGGIEVQDVAQALIALGEEAAPGNHKVVSEELAKIARAGH